MGKIIIAGYGGSGSSAVFDLLKEVDSTLCIEAELRFITDPDGILSLFRAFDRDWSPYNFDLAIRRYLQLVDSLSKKYSQRYSGLDLTEFFGEEFKKFSNEYISNLTDKKFKGIWYGICDSKLRLLHKLHHKYNLPTRSLFEELYIKSNKDFKRETNVYINKLLDITNRFQNDIEHFVIDEPYVSLYLEEMNLLFDDLKIISVQRDPRDIYVNALKYGFAFIPSNVEAFTHWYNNLMNNASFGNSNFKNVLKIQFEDLVYKYQPTKANIFNFLNIDKNSHSNPLSHFNPNKSKKNIELWRDYGNPKEIDFITTNVKDSNTFYKK